MLRQIDETKWQYEVCVGVTFCHFLRVESVYSGENENLNSYHQTLQGCISLRFHTSDLIFVKFSWYGFVTIWQELKENRRGSKGHFQKYWIS